MHKKVLLIILLIISIASIPTKSFAREDTQKQVYVIRIEDAYTKAINENNDFSKNDKSIYNILKGCGATKIIHDRNQYNMESEFKRLYEKMTSGKFLQFNEKAEMVMYYAVFKDSEIFINKDLKPTIDPYDFPNCQTWLSMMQLKITNELLRTKTSDSVRQLYDSLIGSNDTISIMSESDKALELEYKEANQNYKNGKISELEKTEIISNYEIQKLEFNKQKRIKQNTERNLKKILGINLNDEIQIVPYKVLEKDIAVPNYEKSIKRALLNRNEIALVKMNLIVTQNQLAGIDKYLEYFSSDSEMQLTKQETLLRIDELQDEIKTQESYVTKDINTVYAEVDYQNKSIAIEKIKLQTAQKAFDKVKQQYKSGEVSSKTLKKVELEYKKEELNYEKALRELASKVNKLNNSCGVG